ncbi:hypothetical protein F4801DRAFT_599698 [Xylaria longipes]|nr:hypothetical protein F4801DRAFT_599698 [Xylaria longipes]RYC60923.1 hypothetical protein CHU98_g5297 [Xylaria longipes]
MSRHDTPSVHRIGFTRLSRDDSPQARPPKVNIVFVHGLRGHPQTTWEHRQIEKDERTAETSRRRDRFKAIFRPQHTGSTRVSVNEDNINNNGEASTEHNVFWPRDYLLEDVSEAEVWTYGYNADVIGGLFLANNQNSVSQHGRDLAVKLEREIENQAPIIFVAHSLGGIVVKDAIHRSELFQSRTKLIVFLGTPHRGSSYAGWGAIASNLVSLAFQDSNKGLVQTLQVNSEVLDNIQEEFLRIAHRAGIKVHSFQEARAISGVKGLHGKVVDDYSSKVGLPPPFETVESIDANHMQIARCRNKTDPQYHDIVGVLKQFIRSGKLSSDNIKAQESVPAAHIESERGSSLGDTGVRPSIRVGEQSRHMSQSSRHCYYIPLSRNGRFTGRDKILDDLKDKLFAGNPCPKLAVVGLGGIGKTQVVLQLAYWVKDNQPDYSIFWVPAQTDESFEKAYREMARRLDIQVKDDEDLKELVRRYLESEEAKKWLLIVDNADDMDILFGSPNKPSGIDEYLPTSDNVLTVFTTRSREVSRAVAGRDVIDLHKMSVEEATEFLEKALANKQQLQDKASMEELCRELTCLPLAIAQAAAYLDQNQMPIKKYLALLRNTEQNLVSLMSREFQDNTRYRGSQNAVATTWLVSFDQIRRSDTWAAELLSFMSYIEPKAIPQSILPRSPVDEEMEHAIGVLCGYAFLVRRGDEDTFDMHRLVHIATRVWIQKQEIVKETETRAIQHLASALPFDNKEDQLKWREYLQHAQHALRVSQEHQDSKRFELFHRVGRCLYTDRRFKEAIVALEETYRWRKQYLLEEDNNRISSEHNLAGAYLEDRRTKEAIEMFEHVVAVQQKTLVEEDADRLASEHELARAYLEDRRIKEAIEMFEHVVAVQQKKNLAEEDNGRLASEHELARAYRIDGRTREAIGILEHVVAIEQKTLREEDHNRLTSQQVLAGAYRDDKQIKKAVEIYEHVVAVRKKTLAEEDYERLTSEHNLAIAYIEDGRIGEAIEILEQVVAIEKRLDLSDEDRRASQDLLTVAHSML